MAPIRFAVLTVSDRSARGERQDASGPALVKVILEQGWSVFETSTVPDEKLAIQSVLLRWCAGAAVDVILTTGGTGFALRDITPEATTEILERSAPGLAEAMRVESLKVTPHAMLSRGTAGMRGRTLIINLPGSPKAALENLGTILAVLPHAVDLLADNSTSESGHRKLDN
jgi:molybdopterin adenylyltransferase